MKCIEKDKELLLYTKKYEEWNNSTREVAMEFKKLKLQKDELEVN